MRKKNREKNRKVKRQEPVSTVAGTDLEQYLLSEMSEEEKNRAGYAILAALGTIGTSEIFEKEQNITDAPIVADLKRLKNFGISNEERNIADLVIAAIQNGLLDENRSEALSNGYFKLKLKERDTEYWICFGKNPDRIQYPSAERALRASEFVTTLLDLVNTEYNCYVVPSDIGAPDSDVVKKRLFGDATSVKVEYDGEQDIALSENCSRTIELEVEIFAAVGTVYRRMNDTVAVDMIRNPDNSVSCHYEYRKVEHHVPEATVQGDLQKIRKTSNIREILEIVNKNRDKKNILDALYKAEDSEFAKFLNSLATSDRVQVGQVDVQPRSVFICAVPQKTFIYKVSNGYKYGAPKTFTLTWNAAGDDFNSETTLYIETVDGKFSGVTCLQKTENQPMFDRNDQVVYAAEVNAGGSVAGEVTLRIPSTELSFLHSIEIPSEYKGVKNYAITSDYIQKTDAYREKYYLRESLVKGDSWLHLAAEIKLCEYTKKPVWSGNLTKEKVIFVDSSYKLAKGYISKSIANNIDCMHTCVYCQTKYYADKTRWEPYRDKHLLIDGSVCCDKCDECGKEITWNGVLAKLVDGIYPSDYGVGEGKPSGKLYARISENGDYLDPSKGGNVFKCPNCEREICYVGEHSAGKCEICGNRLCRTCMEDQRKAVSLGDKLCGVCPTYERGGFITLNAANYGKCAFNPIDPNDPWEHNRIWVLDYAEKPEFLFHCAECGEEIICNDAKSWDDRCGCCGRLIGKKCWRNINSEPYLGLKFCKDCRGNLNEQYNQKSKEALSISRNREEQKEVLVGEEERLMRKIQSDVEKNMRKLLRYLKTKDRRAIRRARKKGGSAFEIRNVNCIAMTAPSRKKGRSVWSASIIEKVDCIAMTAPSGEPKPLYCRRFQLHFNDSDNQYDFVECNGKFTVGRIE